MPELNAVEFYSGIGGFHCGVDKFNKTNSTDHAISVTNAYDINDNCNRNYRHNFLDTTVSARPIDCMTIEDFHSLSPDIVLMSPPCQPYTRQGNQKDHEDHRAKSFTHLLEKVWGNKKCRKPKYMILENVKGFDVSVTHDMLIKFLKENGYRYFEFLLSPIHLGIPYQRLRYFLVAIHEPTETEVPDIASFPVLRQNQLDADECDDGPSGKRHCLMQRKLSEYLHADAENVDLDEFLAKSEQAKKYLDALDIVDTRSSKTMCFTKAYSRFMKGTGSLINMTPRPDQTDEQERDRARDQRDISNYTLRYFTPREIARLHGFPDSYKFIPSLTKKQQYQMLGNSLSADVIEYLLTFLFST